jgi:MYXO-CTERM domain-containing protein
MFVEDNVIDFDTITNTGAGCADAWGGAGIVWRHNKTKNCLVTAHGVVHSGGPINYELYQNTLEVDDQATGSTDCYRCFHHQGSGEFIAFDNAFTATDGKSGTAISMTHYRSATPGAAGYGNPPGRCDGSQSIDGNRAPNATYRGYPCFRQPGRDGQGNLSPMYVWNNRWSDTGGKIDMIVENPWGASSPSVDDHIKDDRDYYNAVSNQEQTSPTSPFNGTSGMGFGTLVNRPLTCTTNPLEPGGGVGYFAKDDGPNGTLYRCSESNTWIASYRPFSYPHPLAGGPDPSGSGGAGGGGPGVGGADVGGAGSTTGVSSANGASGGMTGSGGAGGDAADDASGCACSMNTANGSRGVLATALAMGLAFARTRRRRRASL